MLCLGLPMISSQAYGFSPEVVSLGQYDAFDVSQFDLDNKIDILAKYGVSSNFVDLILDHDGMTEKEKFLAIQDVADQLLKGHSNISLLIPDPKLSQEELMALHMSDGNQRNSDTATWAMDVISVGVVFVGVVAMIMLILYSGT